MHGTLFDSTVWMPPQSGLLYRSRLYRQDLGGLHLQRRATERYHYLRRARENWIYDDTLTLDHEAENIGEELPSVCDLRPSGTVRPGCNKSVVTAEIIRGP